MTATPAQGIRLQADVPALPSRSNSATSSHLAPTSAHPTASPAPLTPERGRSTNRYPDSLGRVPLHRRGTSKTYERLEDLLREAGYKETRVFTPETDRNPRSASSKHDGGAGSSMRSSVGAVVDFIAGLVSRGSSLPREAEPLKDGSAQPALHAWSPPPSPLAHALHIKNDRAQRISSMASLPRKGSSESICRHNYVDVSADASQRTRTTVQLHQSSQGLPHHPHLKHNAPHHHANNHRHHQPRNYSSKPSSTKPNPPNARAYLRHMASAPNIQPLTERPPLSEASLRSHAIGREHRSRMRHTFILNDEDSIAESDCEYHARTIDDDERQAHPPLPRNWIDSVARALLIGVGGPAAATSDAASTRTAKTVSTRKSSAMSDKSNQEARGRVPKRVTRPPLLCAQVQDMKAKTSEGRVACTNVMCRSTPTSRAGSRVRNSGHDEHANATSGGRRRGGDKPGNRRRRKDRDADVLPSLARTKVENDWMAPRHRFSGGWGLEGRARADPEGPWSDNSDGGGRDGDDDDDDDEEDEEGELGLDRLLVPALRQHSIQSLRKHLQRPPSRMSSDHGAPHSRRSPRSGRGSPFGGSPASRRNWGGASWGTSRGREWAASQGEEDEDGYSHVYSSATAGRGSTRWRRGLPGLAQWTASS